MNGPLAKIDAALLASERAIRHTLEQIAGDPRKWYLFGYGSETYALLTEALAHHLQESVEMIQENYHPDPEAMKRYRAERERTDKLLEVAQQAEHWLAEEARNPGQTTPKAILEALREAIGEERGAS